MYRAAHVTRQPCGPAITSPQLGLQLSEGLTPCQSLSHLGMLPLTLAPATVSNLGPVTQGQSVPSLLFFCKYFILLERQIT